LETEDQSCAKKGVHDISIGYLVHGTSVMGSVTPARSKVAKPVVLVFMGVSGCGKTTVAGLLADRLGWPFEEGDSLHPQTNIEKMKAGHPLTDADREPWLAAVAEWIDRRLDAGENGLITCSALKRSDRDVINRRGSGVLFVFLAGSKATIAPRLEARHAHFMPSSLLDSQFADLVDLAPDEPHIRVDIGPPPSVIAEGIWQDLRLGD
jgi:carbohydrate kinase (thermoresistant glucokinase family)